LVVVFFASKLDVDDSLFVLSDGAFEEEFANEFLLMLFVIGFFCGVFNLAMLFSSCSFCSFRFLTAMSAELLVFDEFMLILVQFELVDDEEAVESVRDRFN
jgi:hypothetical protein